MENFMTIDEIINLYGVSVFGESDDISQNVDNFLVKDRASKSARRKKTYFKGKNRYDRICQKGFTPSPEKEDKIKGMLRRTTVNYPTDLHHKVDISTIRRDLNANEKLKDYYAEVV